MCTSTHETQLMRDAIETEEDEEGAEDVEARTHKRK